MPADRTQLNRERIDALTEILEEAGIATSEHVVALRDAEEIGEAPAIAEAARQGEPPGREVP